MHLTKRVLLITALASTFFFTVNAAHHKGNVDVDLLQSTVDARTDEESARDTFRNPVATLSFFQVAPGMTVAEALPGGGWYSKIIANYLGGDGAIYGINYADEMWPMFGFFSEERMSQMIARTTAFPDNVNDFTDNGIAAEGFTFANVPAKLAGTADRVLFVRALHNLSRFEEEAGTLTQAIKASHTLLKPGGMVGVVQHRIAESASDENATGSRGYLKQSFVTNAFTQAGFSLVASSEINANPKDVPSESDIVWRLPPSLNGSQDNPEMRKAMLEIGESDRMTLLFVKN